MSAPEGSTARQLEQMAEALNSGQAMSEEQSASMKQAFGVLRERVQFFQSAMHGVAGAVRDAMEPLEDLKRGLRRADRGLYQQRHLNDGRRELSPLEKAAKRRKRKAHTTARKRHAKKK